MNGTDWVEQTMAKVLAAENEVYASIGAYDRAAFEQYCANERERLTKIADELTGNGYDWDMAYPYGNIDHERKVERPEPEEAFVYGMQHETREYRREMEDSLRIPEREAERQSERDAELAVAGRLYNSYRHDPDSIGFDDSYTGTSERELAGGCNRCGGMDDCYCPSPGEIQVEQEAEWERKTERLNR